MADANGGDQLRAKSIQGVNMELQFTFSIPNPEVLADLNEEDLHRSLERFARTNGFSFEGFKVCFSEDDNG